MTNSITFARTFWISVVASITIAFLPMAANAEGTFSGKVVSVIDGDTINIAHGDTKERVILFGIDCPEIGQDFGEQARNFTDDSCFRQVVTVEDHGKDPKGRTIGVIILPNGTNLNQDLVKHGLAWWSDKYAPNDTTLKQLHASAKSQKIGLWSASNPIPPWIFRNGARDVQATIKPSK